MMALLLTACAGSEQEATGVEKNRIALTAAIDPEGDAERLDGATRSGSQDFDAASGYTQFAAGQQVALSMPGALRDDGSRTLTALTTANADMVTATVSDADGQRLLTTDDDYYWPVTGSGLLTFRAFYPAALATVTDEGVATDPVAFEVSNSQGDVAPPTLSDGTSSADVLYATAAASRTSLPVPLTFSHQMAKVTVTMVAGAGVTDAILRRSTLMLTGVCRGATLNRATGAVTTVTNPSDPGYVAPDGITMKDAGNTALETYCLLPPGQPLPGSQFLFMIPEDYLSTYTIPQADPYGHGAPEDFVLQAGMNYHYVLTVSTTEVTAALVGVVPWVYEYISDASSAGPRYQPMTIEVNNAGSVRMENVNGAVLPTGKIYQYRKYTAATGAWGGWNDFTPGTTTVSVAQGDKVQLRGNFQAINGTGSGGVSAYYALRTPSGTALSGNTMSLIGSYDNAGRLTDFVTYPAVPTAGFACLFRGDTGLTDASRLVMPSSAMSQYGCQSMFQDCTNLTAAPTLPSPELANYCYYSMFQGCTSLTTLPAGMLPATTMDYYCYYSMFQGCTGLTSLPAGLLPATTLDYNCYGSMFKGCTGLTSLPAGLLPATTLASRCYYNMFADCNKITNTPKLNAETLVSECYFFMFYGCSSLRTVYCYASSGIYTSNSTASWLNGVAASGTFYKNPATPVGSGTAGKYWPTSNSSGIPSSWTVQDYIP